MRAPEFSDEQLLRHLRSAAAELGEPLPASAYDAWQRGRDAASPALLIRRFGSWNEACAKAGVGTNKTRSTSRRWSDDDVIAVVASYLSRPGSTGTFADYSAWAREQAGAPSGATLRQRYPSWTEVKQLAQARRERGPAAG
ncbi:homing endonuclease associated repeat-containing protein [Nocardioides sp. SYSU DS0651]|uniref:homing endonuclease associated repeat-containing protein n=1 Tax=Nocardioides sp. SYSU DS0651 TaxID=3415955 RepID=UPI003F4C3619